MVDAKIFQNGVTPTSDFKLPASESFSSGIENCKIMWNFNLVYELERLFLAMSNWTKELGL